MTVVKTFPHDQLTSRKYTSVGRTRKEWNCNCCGSTIPVGGENETSWTSDRKHLIRLCLGCVHQLKCQRPPIIEALAYLDERISAISKLYVLIVNTGEAIKREFSYPALPPETIENAKERFMAITEGMLSKTEVVANLNQQFKEKENDRN